MKSSTKMSTQDNGSGSLFSDARSSGTGSTAGISSGTEGTADGCGSLFSDTRGSGTERTEGISSGTGGTTGSCGS